MDELFKLVKCYNLPSHMLHVWYIYLHDWVILLGQMLGFIFQHHGSHMGYKNTPIRWKFPTSPMVSKWVFSIRGMGLEVIGSFGNIFTRNHPILWFPYQETVVVCAP
jgi:hypothetical protein